MCSRGARAAALALTPTLTRSELEDRFLMLCRAHRIPRPLVNEEVAGLEVNFFWPSARLAVDTTAEPTTSRVMPSSEIANATRGSCSPRYACFG